MVKVGNTITSVVTGEGMVMVNTITSVVTGEGIWLTPLQV